MPEKVESFLVNVTIIEGRHLAWMNMDSAVQVKVDNQRKCTGIRYSTDSPYFNEYFVFEFNTSLQKLIDKLITLTVIQPRKLCRFKKTLGYVTLDLATVWTQPDHQFYHKWAILAPPISDPSGSPRGYLKVDINIVSKGEFPKIPPIDAQDTDEIEGNLMLPDGLTTERQRTNYVFKIYRAEDIFKPKHLDVKYPPPPEKDPPNPYIEVHFAGLKTKTSTRKNCTNPVWNESLVLTELFPPLCQRIKIYLKSADHCQDTTLAVRHINLRSISNDKEQGFLPTFGPAFLYFYGKGNTSEGYVGKALISFTTELQVHAGASKSTNVEPIRALPEINMWKIEPVILFGIVVNANLIDKKYNDKPISFEINFGKFETEDNKLFLNRTNPQAAMANGKLYWYLDYGQDKPCLFVISYWPDFRKRYYISNMISKITVEMKSKLVAIEQVLIKEQYSAPSRQLENLLLDATDFVSTACRKYLDITEVDGSDFETLLDKERKKLCRREMVQLNLITFCHENIHQMPKSAANLNSRDGKEEIEIMIQNIYEPTMKKKCYETMLKLLYRLESLIDDEQDCWPYIYVSMICGSKRVAFAKCHTRDLVYSVVREEKGKCCGTIQSLFLQPNSSKKLLTTVSCKLDIILWVGPERRRRACLKIIPPGFIPPSDLTENAIPTYLVAQEKYYFQCRVHVYQGKFLPGSDRSGLCDPFARVIVGGECRQTAVSQATLHPVWDQSLIYTKLVLYGAKPYIKANPPLIVMEVFDQDECCRNEFVGRCMFNPVVKFVENPYAAPNFPPKLKWHNIVKGADILGEVLVVAELLEMSADLDQINLKPTNDIVRIPTDIKPNMVKYRIEAIFWGVRELKKLNLLPVTKPKVVLECAYAALHSDTILATKKNLNFTQPHKQIIVLPDQEDYIPPICIKMFDCRSFGRYTLAGTHIINVTPFLYQLVTLEEKNKKFIKSQGLLLDHDRSTGKLSVIIEDVPSKSEREPRWKLVLKKIFYIFTNRIKDSNITKNLIEEKAVLPKNSKKKKAAKSEVQNETTKSPKVRRSRLKKCLKILFCCCLFPFFICKRKKKIAKEGGKETSEESGSASDDTKKSYRKKSRKKKSRNTRKVTFYEEPIEDTDDDEFDWWTKYYNSVEMTPVKAKNDDRKDVQLKKSKCTLKIYSTELESQLEFGGFADILQTFQMYRGKRTGDETVDEENITGIFKGAIKVYQWPQPDNCTYVTPSGLSLENGVFQDFVPNDAVKFVVRVYCVKGMNLRPKDASGKSDPYICVTMGNQTIKDRNNYVPQQINPVFGRCFELQGMFSLDHAVTVAVWDWDMTSSDDLIGETKIDIENRYYTRHRAHCGIAAEYKEKGYCLWRDNERPTQILEKLCKKNNIHRPQFTDTSVRILDKEYSLATDTTGESQTSYSFSKQDLALSALRRWQEVPVVGCHLVPEHVETRSLYHPAKPGIEQGKLQLWVDIFPCTDLPPPQQVDIATRKPVAYELRVIIWNTDDVILDEDDFFVGEKMSDIYVKGWITNSNESQNTDVHYRSMTGEGSFNWRFVFHFKYISTENKLVIAKKESIFSVGETEYKMPCKLNLQVWDNDTFSADDFLGSVSLELCRLPRGARSADKCTLQNLGPEAPTLNLFKIKRTKGWWPFRGVDKETKKDIVTGKVEMELELITQEEADKNPVGLARAEPQPLPLPARPDTSFSWFRNPLKAIQFLMCNHYRCRIIKCFIFLLILFGIAAGVYAVPGYSVKKLLGVK